MSADYPTSAQPEPAEEARAIAARVRDFIDRLESRCATLGRAMPLLVAASKTRSAADVAAAHAAGITHFGENYVQEAVAKIAGLNALGRTARWHLIGALQGNKAALAAATFDCVESVDRPRIAMLLDRHRAEGPRGPLDVLIEVNVDGEASKAGCAPTALWALADDVLARPALRLRGLMAVPKPCATGAPRLAFARVQALFEQLRQQAPECDRLSIGMSGDFEAALEFGATEIRIGSALFGPRA